MTAAESGAENILLPGGPEPSLRFCSDIYYGPGINIAPGHHSAGGISGAFDIRSICGWRSSDAPHFLLCLHPLEHPPGATFLFHFHFLFTFFKVLEGLFLKVLEEVQPEPLLQAVAVEPEQTLQAVPAGGTTL